MVTMLELLEATFSQIEKFLEIVQRFEKLRENWSVIKETAKKELRVGDERLYKIRNACARLRLIDKGLEECRLTAEGLSMLNSNNRLDFLAGHVCQLDDRLKILKAIDAICKCTSTPIGDYVSLANVADQLELKSLHRLWATLDSLYSSLGLVELRGSPNTANKKVNYSQVQVKLKTGRIEKLMEIVPWRRAGEISNEEFFEVLLKFYEGLKDEYGTIYVPIPELRKRVGYQIRLDYDGFNTKLLQLPPVFDKRKIVLISPRGPREGAIEVKRSNGSFERYLHIIIE